MCSSITADAPLKRKKIHFISQWTFQQVGSNGSTLIFASAQAIISATKCPSFPCHQSTTTEANNPVAVVVLLLLASTYYERLLITFSSNQMSEPSPINSRRNKQACCCRCLFLLLATTIKILRRVCQLSAAFQFIRATTHGAKS